MLMKRFGKSLLIASLSLLAQATIVSLGMAQEAASVVGVTRFAQYQGRYAVSFPITRFGHPRINTRANEMSADVDIDGAGYFVICMDLHDVAPAETLFDDIEAYAARANHARVVRKAPIAIGSFPGREVELENENGWQRIVRDYVVGNRFYCVGAQARDRKLNREMVNEFIDSFSLLKGKAPPPTVMPAPSPVPAPSAGTAPLPATQASAPQWLQWNELAPPAVPAPPSQSVPAPTPDRRYVNKNGRYLVDFPGAPTESQRSLPNGLVVHQAVVERQGVAYVVTYYDLPASQLNWGQSQPGGMAALASLWKDEVIGNMHATLKHEGIVRVAGRDAYEAEFTAADGTHLIGQMVLVGARCYCVAVGGAGIAADNPLVRQYLESFGIVD
jgi:hypothetical protein